jgi:transcriptional regulator with XRE-family HTH domain
MKAHSRTEFFPLGRAIAAARLAAGMAKQSDLASALNVSQQTVSRWEAGIARPKEKQLHAIAVVLKMNPADLRRLAGDEGPPATSFVELFPVDRLPPTTFEQFVTDLVAVENPGADVRRAGGSGHDQRGLDIDAILVDGRRMGLQCKRVQRFGPADAAFAIADFRAENYDEKILVLSRIASPQTAEMVRSHAGWQLWDKDDLSRRVRSLPVAAQERLVDIYFRGQRQALLGRSESGPWQTTEEFFLPFDGPDRPLSHSWELLGREKETADLAAMLVRPGVQMITLVAAGGMGKSRLLKEVMMSFCGREPSVCVRFLSGAADPTRQGLDDLGPGPKVLVVDDAHDRDGLSVLFEYVADLSHQTKLILATRNYAFERICNEAARYNVSSAEVRLGTLGRDQLRAIANRILKHFNNADENLARYVVAASGDSPMIVAMAAQVLAKDKIPVELAKNEDAFRRVVLGKFAKVVAGHLGNAGDERLHREVLDVLALVQPFHPEDPQLLALLEHVQGLRTDIAAAALARFAQGGVIFRRGHQWRLMPDVLGDYLIETSCVDAVDRLSPFAEKTLRAVTSTILFKHALVNLGRLDWRRRAGDTADSDFLTQIWRALYDIDDDFDPRLDAIKSIALYQPRQALEFAIHQARRGRLLRVLPGILSGIARTGDYLAEAMELLWEIGRFDDRELGPNPNHAIRVLVELGNYDGRKAFDSCKALLAFGLKLAENDENWRGRYTPLDVLKPLLSVEGTNNSSDGRTMTLAPYFINYKVVGPLRAEIINKIIALLKHSDVAIACVAGSCLESAIRYPHGLMGSAPPKELRASLSKEFADTLEQVRQVVDQGLHPLVALAIARSVSWQAKHGQSKPAGLAREIFRSLPTGLEFRLLAALVDGWGQIFVEQGDPGRWQIDLNEWFASVASDFRNAAHDPRDRLSYLERALVTLKEAGESQSSAHMLIHKLVEDSDFARTLLEDASTRTTALTRRYAGQALSRLMHASKIEGRAYARRFVESGDRELCIAAAQAYTSHQIEEDDKDLIKLLLSSTDSSIVYHAIHAVWLWDINDDSEVVELLLSANVAENVGLVDEVAMALCGGGRRRVDALTEEDAAALLTRLAPIDQLKGYWIDDLLAVFSLRFPYLTAQFFMDRVEMAASQESYSFRPANFGPYSHKKLQFLESSEYLDVLNAVWHWLRQNRDRDHYFQYAAAHMFEAMFLGSTEMLVAFFRPMLPGADAGDLRLMGRLLREGHHSFVLAYGGFVVELLERCQAVDFDLQEEISSQLYASATSGFRSGVPGEPMPRDLADKEGAEEILASLSRLSPAYALFDGIRKSAISSIEHTKLDDEGLDE